MESRVNHQKSGNKIAIFFVAKLLICYVIFSQGNLFMNALFSKGGIYNAFLAEHFNYVQGIKTALIVPAAAIIKLFGFYVVHNDSDVMVVNGPYLQVHYDCLGLGVMSFLAAFAIAFPAKLKAKVKLLLIGFVMIYVLNVLRIAGLAVLLAHSTNQQENFVYHHEIFNVFIYICLFLLIYFWIKKAPQQLSGLTTQTKLNNTTQLRKNFNKKDFDTGASTLKVFCWYLVSALFFRSGLIPFSSILVALLRLFGAKVGKEVRIKPYLYIHYPWKLSIGDYSWLAECRIENLAQIDIGKNVCISQKAMLLTGNHDYKKVGFDLIARPILLEDGVWIGANATVCPGITVHSHAVLTVGAIATKDLEAYGIYQGNPAVKVKERLIS